MDREALLRAFEEAVDRMREGPVGSELRSAYEGPERVARARTFWGEPVDVVLPELVSCELDRYGLIEPGLTRLIIDEVGPGMTFLDVGAHVGYFSLLAAALGADVHAFEPAAGTRELLERNVRAHATVVGKGVWHENGRLELQDFGPRHSALNTFVASKDDSLQEPQETHIVEVATIDDYCGGSISPSFIKIDAEGGERNVLLGARDTIARCRPIVTIEVGDAPGTPRSRDVLDLARSLGYELYDVAADRRSPHVLQDSYRYGNVALIPRD